LPLLSPQQRGLSLCPGIEILVIVGFDRAHYPPPYLKPFATVLEACFFPRVMPFFLFPFVAYCSKNVARKQDISWRGCRMASRRGRATIFFPNPYRGENPLLPLAAILTAL
jgi:hypothetical protein